VHPATAAYKQLAFSPRGPASVSGYHRRVSKRIADPTSSPRLTPPSAARAGAWRRHPAPHIATPNYRSPLYSTHTGLDSPNEPRAMTGGRDLELNELHSTRSHAEGSSFTVYGHSQSAVGGAGFRGTVGRFVDSFRRDDGSEGRRSSVGDHPPSIAVDDGFAPDVQVARDHRGERYYDLRSANAKTSNPLLTRELKGRHLQMIAIGGSIGTGLFVASGKTLSQGGPASVLLAYLFIGVMLYCTVQALGEMAVVFPVAGSFSAFSTRFLDPSWGFAMGWK